MERGFWRLLVLLAVVLSGSLRLEKVLTNHYVLELYLLMMAVLIGAIVLVGVAWSKSWGWPLATMLFAATTLNALIVYFSSHNSKLMFALVMLGSLLGLILAVMRATEPEGDPLLDLPKMEFSAPRATR